MGSGGGAIRVMEKPLISGGEEKPQQPPPPPPPQQPLKCPRCDSLNTKFCYYNNYSLSQPRHFCKACKRYWTRGGTLRNVPVGGGCRKNKRMRRPSTSPSAAAATANGHDQSSPPMITSLQPQPQIGLSSSSSAPHHPVINPFVYGGFPGNRAFEPPGYDHHNMGLGFSFSGLLGAVENNNNAAGFPNPYPVFGSSSSSAASTAALASLLASRLHYQAATMTSNGFHSGPYIENIGGGERVKEVKMEVMNNWENHKTGNGTGSGGGSGNVSNAHYEMVNQTGQNNTSDNNHNNNNNPASLSWTWFDPSNMGSSVPSIL
ncbi:unnamed protein product [Cuscuta epithymum]|nr:unnamed protein product [Cuscuta epithymum]